MRCGRETLGAGVTSARRKIRPWHDIGHGNWAIPILLRSVRGPHRVRAEQANSRCGVRSPLRVDIIVFLGQRCTWFISRHGCHFHGSPTLHRRHSRYQIGTCTIRHPKYDPPQFPRSLHTAHGNHTCHHVVQPATNDRHSATHLCSLLGIHQDLNTCSMALLPARINTWQPWRSSPMAAAPSATLPTKLSLC